jgi:hypothetical protein
MHVAKLGLETSIPSLFCGDGINCCTFGGSKAVFVPLLAAKFEILVPF